MSSANLTSSQFTHATDAGSAHPGMHLLYHTATGVLALADACMMDALAHPEGDKEAAAILSDAGFLVSAETDELAILEGAYRGAQQDPSALSLLIAPTYACNLACPYCYESGHDAADCMMDESVQDAVLSFVERFYDERPFATLDVQWYGGEPLLGPHVIERLSHAFMAFCEQKGLGYSAMIITNATRATEEVAQMLVQCSVQNALITIDGPREVHNARRPARDGSDSYEAVCAGIGNLLRAGVQVEVLMNTDHLNYDALDELNADLMARFGIIARHTLLNDYFQTYGEGGFRDGPFRLMLHEEFAHKQCAAFCKSGLSAQDVSQMLAPAPTFCRGQKENYFAIDAAGDAYKCDGYLGRTECALFNVAHPEDYQGDTAPAYPFDDEACTHCSLLPICKGTCEWERKSCADHPCHPIKHTMDEYLRAWLSALEPVTPSPTGLTILT